MKRKIEKIVTSCEECPYREYDSHYGMSYDSGYDCNKNGERMMDDGTERRFEKEMEEINKQNETLFKYEGEVPVHPLVKYFNEKCPLTKIEE